MSDTTIDRARALLALREKATPVDGAVFREYDHGGGRLFVEAPQRRLILDVYHEGNRDFFFSAHKMADTIAELLAEVERLTLAASEHRDGRLAALERATAAEARLRELASAEPVAWKSEYWDFVSRERLDQSWQPLIRRPEMPS